MFQNRILHLLGLKKTTLKAREPTYIHVHVHVCSTSMSYSKKCNIRGSLLPQVRVLNVFSTRRIVITAPHCARIDTARTDQWLPWLPTTHSEWKRHQEPVRRRRPARNCLAWRRTPEHRRRRREKPVRTRLQSQR